MRRLAVKPTPIVPVRCYQPRHLLHNRKQSGANTCAIPVHLIGGAAYPASAARHHRADAPRAAAAAIAAAAIAVAAHE